jgi:HK97 gp10 family phage protein
VLLRHFDDAIEDAAKTAAAEMTRRAPVATGDLKGSIKAERTGRFRAGVGIGTFYWHFVNYGTSRSAARPFVEPGVQRGVEQLRKARL